MARLVQPLEEELLASAGQLERYAETVRHQLYGGRETNGYHYLIDAARLQREASRRLAKTPAQQQTESLLDRIIRWFGCGQ